MSERPLDDAYSEVEAQRRFLGALKAGEYSAQAAQGQAEDTQEGEEEACQVNCQQGLRRLTV